MAKSAKNAPPRKPVRARGALPVPKSAPKRSRSAWYMLPGYQLVAIAVGIALIGTFLKVGGDWLHSRKDRQANTQAVRKFDQKYQLAKAPASQILPGLAGISGDIKSGKLTAADLKKQTDGWLAELRKLDTSLRSATIPPTLPELDEVRAALVQGNVVGIDAVKGIQLAAANADAGAKEQALKLVLNVAGHSQNITTAAEAKLAALKVRFGVGRRPAASSDTAPGPAPIQLPSEESPGGQAGISTGVPGQATTTVP